MDPDLSDPETLGLSDPDPYFIVHSSVAELGCLYWIRIFPYRIPDPL